MGWSIHRFFAHGHDVHLHVFRPRRACDHRADRRRRVWFCTARFRTVGRFPVRRCDPHRIRHRASGNRRVHRRLLQILVRHRRLACVSRLLRRLSRYPYLRCGRSFASHLRDHRRRRGRAHRLRGCHGPFLQLRQTVRHSSDRRDRGQCLPAVWIHWHLDGDSVRDVVFPRHRGRAARGRGDARSQARSAARPLGRHGGASAVLRAHTDTWARRRRVCRTAGIR